MYLNTTFHHLRLDHGAASIRNNQVDGCCSSTKHTNIIIINITMSVSIFVGHVSVLYLLMSKVLVVVLFLTCAFTTSSLCHIYEAQNCLNWLLLLAHQNNELVNFVASYPAQQFFWNSNLAGVKVCVRNPKETKLFWTTKCCCQITGTQLHRNKVSAFNLFNLF